MDIAEFVKARLDEWEQRGRAAYPHQTGSRDEGQPPEHVSWRRGPGSVEFGLRHVATLRAIVADCERAIGPQRELSRYAAPGTPYDAPHANVAFRTLCALAADWSTHRDYNESWKLS
jgi:hypothetical protein